MMLKVKWRLRWRQVEARYIYKMDRHADRELIGDGYICKEKLL